MPAHATTLQYDMYEIINVIFHELYGIMMMHVLDIVLYLQHISNGRFYLMHR